MDLKRQAASQLRNKRRLKRLPKPKSIRPIERDYERGLVDILKTLQGLIQERLLTQLPRLQNSFNANLPQAAKFDDASDDIASIINGIRVEFAKRWTPTQIRRFAQNQGISVSAYNKRIVSEGLKQVLGIDVFFSEPYLAQELNLFAMLNTKLITNMTEEAINRVERDVLLNFSQGMRWEENAKQIEKYIDADRGTVRNRAKLIARDQTNKLNGQLNELRQAEIGVDRYIWRTSLDERVRESHRALEGKVFKWSEPPAGGHPGQPINCRCTAEPYLAGLIEGEK